MPICIKHKVNYDSEECPECKKIREGISLHYESNDPVHKSEYMLDRIERLKFYTNKLNELNAEITKTLDNFKKGKK